MVKTKPVRLQNLRVLLFSKDITQDYLAERWGVSPCYVSNRLSGRYELKNAEKEDLCKMLDVKTAKEYLTLFHPVMAGKLE